MAPAGVVAAVVAAAGGLSGLLGVGGGLVPGLSEVLGLPLKRAIATSLASASALRDVVLVRAGVIMMKASGRQDFFFVKAMLRVSALLSQSAASLRRGECTALSCVRWSGSSDGPHPHHGQVVRKASWSLGKAAREDVGVEEGLLPDWISCVTAAADRLEAEADDEVEDLFQDSGTGFGFEERRSRQAVRFEESAQLSEIAADLAGLLWAEREEVPLIDTILEEPAARAALEGVAEARRRGARHLAAGKSPSAGGSGAPPAGVATPAAVATLAAPPTDPAESSPRQSNRAAPEVDAQEIAIGEGSLRPLWLPAAGRAPVSRPVRTAALAGATAAAIVLFGRRIRRA